MKIRTLLRIFIPVCALAAASCTNEELISEASQTQRGRDFAEAFHARLGDVDPNHTWVDATVGKVSVTTDEKANVVIYALGLNGNGLIKLKHTVVDGAAEVKYDIPLGAKNIVLRAYNKNGNVYKTLDPSKDNDEAVMTFNGGTRAMTSLNGVTAQAASEIPNVWNIYGSIAPYQTDIPACLEPVSTQVPYTLHGQTYYARDWNFYYEVGGQKYNMYSNLDGSLNSKLFKDFVPVSYLGSVDNFLAQTRLLASDQKTDANPNGLWQVVKIETIAETANQHYYSAYIYDLENEEMVGSYLLQQQVENTSYFSLSTTLVNGTSVRIPDGVYFNFKPCGKRGSWWIQQGQGFGHFYTTSMDLSQTTSGTLVNNNYYHDNLNQEVMTYINNLLTQAEDDPDVLLEYNTDAGFTTLENGPVSITWIPSPTTTASYIGYYYTVGEETEAKLNAAPRYVLMCNRAGYTQGDTFPLTYYGANYNQYSPDFEFPKGVNIHFFIVHGRDSSTNDPHPHSGYSSWTAKGQQSGEWLFYDANNGWTLDAWYLAYSQGGVVNEAPINRIYDNQGVHPDPYIYTLLDGDYKPTVAFNYGGYNLIGFEDTPVKEWGNGKSALDWNDCIFLLNGNFDIKSVEDEMEYALCLEDLGGTDDLDYNDLYMTVKQPETKLLTSGTVIYDAPKFTVHQVGGTLPMKISFEDGVHDPTLFNEIHAAFGMPSDVAINTTDKIRATDGIQEVTFTSNGNDGVSPAVIKCAVGLGSRTATLQGFTEDDTNDFSIIEHASDIKFLVTYKDNTSNVEGGQTVISVPTQEVAYEGTQKIPYAFVIPKLLKNPETGKYDLDNTEYDTFTPPTERVYIGFKYPTFTNWVANQNANNTKWYHFHWSATTDNSDWDAPSQGGGQGGGGDTPTTMTYTVPAQFIQSMGTGWTVGNQSNLIPASNFLSGATSIVVDIAFTETINNSTANIPLYYFSNYNWNQQSQNYVNGKSSISVTIDDAAIITAILDRGLDIQLWDGMTVDKISSIVITSSK